MPLAVSQSQTSVPSRSMASSRYPPPGKTTTAAPVFFPLRGINRDGGLCDRTDSCHRLARNSPAVDGNQLGAGDRLRIGCGPRPYRRLRVPRGWLPASLLRAQTASGEGHTECQEDGGDGRIGIALELHAHSMPNSSVGNVDDSGSRADLSLPSSCGRVIGASFLSEASHANN